jgi:hypothetical protein
MADNRKRQPSSAARPRKRTLGVTVMVSEAERQAMRQAADQAELPLSVFLRLLVMAAIRSGQTVGLATEEYRHVHAVRFAQEHQG